MRFLSDKGGEISGRSVFGASTMASLLKHQGISSHPFETFLVPPFHETRSRLNFGDVVCAKALCRSLELEEAIGEDYMDDDNPLHHHPEKKRRLSTNQVQFLEKSFEVDNKLEPERKTQLASELGLQPRQVAVWFQNRRARWKSKQLEKDLAALKSNYNALKLDYENLRKENQKLNAEVLSLTDKLLLQELGDKGKPEIKNNIQQSQQNVNFFQASVSCKQEDLISSTNSVIVDNDSEAAGARTPLFEPTVSSNAFEPEKSDLSHVEEDNEVKQQQYTYDFALEDQEQSLWLWPY